MHRHCPPRRRSGGDSAHAPAARCGSGRSGGHARTRGRPLAALVAHTETGIGRFSPRTRTGLARGRHERRGGHAAQRSAPRYFAAHGSALSRRGAGAVPLFRSAGRGKRFSGRGDGPLGAKPRGIARGRLLAVCAAARDGHPPPLFPRADGRGSYMGARLCARGAVRPAARPGEFCPTAGSPRKQNPVCIFSNRPAGRARPFH